MCCLILFLYFILCFENMTCKSYDDTLKLKSVTSNISLYKGESFPTKYLLPEESSISKSDLEYYIKKIHLTVTHFYNEMINYNDTEVNRALGMFFMKAVLKRTARDYHNKLTKTHLHLLKDIIKKGDCYVSHYVYMTKQNLNDSTNDKLEYRVAKVLRDDSVQVYSVGNFNKGRLKKWILGNFYMHPYTEEMDNLTLPREKYADITEHMDSFSISVGISDECLSRVVYNPEPIDLSELRPCRPDPFCKRPLLSSPSASYALSHRLLNLLMLRHSRRCYIQTAKKDEKLMDTLCAFMYREAVYLARRGFFARDVFLEHVALCSLFGYEEFFRQRWFRKVASWMDDQGCISESGNFLVNRTRLQIENEKDVKKIFRLRKRLKWSLLEECHSHPMALLSVVLAHAISYKQCTIFYYNSGWNNVATKNDTKMIEFLNATTALIRIYSKQLNKLHSNAVEMLCTIKKVINY